MADPRTQPEASDIDQLCINTIRTLAIDAIQKANSGHPGTPMALAPVAYVLWQRFLRFDPANPIWPNRDRFVLSAGHASMLLYALLHLAGVRAVDPDYEVGHEHAVSLADIESFRQLDSRAPGHPEYRWTSGVETTTGPLGQGIATSVGMAIACKWQAAHFNRPEHELFGFDTFAIAGDGCLMEGVLSEAASIAGHQRLDNLCWIYDNNDRWPHRHHLRGQGERPLRRLRLEPDPGRGRQRQRRDRACLRELPLRDRAPDADHRRLPHRLRLTPQGRHGRGPRRAAWHRGGARDQARIRLARGRSVSGPRRGARTFRRRGRPPRGRGERRVDRAVRLLHDGGTEQAAQLEAMQRRELPEGWDSEIPSFDADAVGVATRKASNQVENAVAAKVPWLLAGSADLTGSTSVGLEGATDFEPSDRRGRQMHYGIREHESAAICNGLSLSKLRPLWSTYLTFSDYARPAIRLSSLMELPVIHVFTHDSIGLGEDGPTHQPVEQICSLRAIPGLDVIRPADANEVAEAWRIAMDRHHQPVALVLTRQNVPVIDRSKFAPAEGARRGGYVLADPDSGAGGEPEVILLATGSEVALALEAHEALIADGVASRVVSLPCWELFDRQEQAYRDEVLPPSVTARVSVEEASTLGWDRYVGPDGIKIGMHTFGTSAPLKDVQSKFGFTPDKVAEAAKEVLR